MQSRADGGSDVRFNFGFVIVAIVMIAILTATPARAQRDFSGVEVETVEVAAGVHMLSAAGGNIGVSTGEDGIFLVDDQYAMLTEKIVAALARIQAGPVRFVLNTHWHGDHTGGNENLGQAGALLVAHDNVRTRLSVEQFIEAYGARVPASPPDALPVVTFNDTVTFHFNGTEIHAFHVGPGHTDGDSVVHFREANVIHTGDLYWSGMYPFIDTSSGGSMSGVIDAVDRILLLANAETKIIPGHGSLSNTGELRAYRAMLATIRDRIYAMIDAGKTVEEVLEAAPTADFDEAWGGGFLPPERWIPIVYTNLKRASE